MIKKSKHSKNLKIMDIHNYFSSDTGFWTNKGIKKFNQFKDKDEVLVRGRNKWRKATLRCAGIQSMIELIVNKGDLWFKIKTTENNLWKIFKSKRPILTRLLNPGMRLKYFIKQPKFELNNIGIQHGIIYGDGYQYSNMCGINFSNNQKELVKYFPHNYTNIKGLPKEWKELPSTENKEYLYGFLAGWFAVSGYIRDRDRAIVLSNSNKKIIEWIRNICMTLDITTFFSEPIIERWFLSQVKKTRYGVIISRDFLPDSFFLLSSHRCKILTQKYKKSFWTVYSVVKTIVKEKGWYVVEPQKKEFVLEHGILTVAS